MTEIPFQSTDPKYDRLVRVLHAAYGQAAEGKGKERHANGLPFDEQPMQTISHLLKSEKGMAFQAMKKITEGLGLPTHEQRVRELLGSIVYIAGIIIFLEDQNAAEVDAGTSPQLVTVYKYHATDLDGTRHLFTHRPEFNERGGFWRMKAGYCCVEAKLPPLKDDAAARVSLEQIYPAIHKSGSHGQWSLPK